MLRPRPTLTLGPHFYLYESSVYPPRQPVCLFHLVSSTFFLFFFFFNISLSSFLAKNVFVKREREREKEGERKKTYIDTFVHNVDNTILQPPPFRRTYNAKGVFPSPALQVEEEGGVTFCCFILLVLLMFCRFFFSSFPLNELFQRKNLFTNSTSFLARAFFSQYFFFSV